MSVLTTSALSAQSATSASVSGQVTDGMGQTVGGAVVTLEPRGAGAGQETTTTNDGTFRFALVAPGSYEVRAEAIGFRPLVARTLILSGGEAARVSLALTREPPPVSSVDTVAIQANAATRVRAGAVRVGTDDLRQPTGRYEDISTATALSTRFDPSFGSEGLPGSMSVVFADGVPVYSPVRPWSADRRPADMLFPTSFVTGVTAFHRPADLEWAGSASGIVGISTTSGTGAQGVEAGASWSGGPLWSSPRLDLDDPPGLNSFWVDAIGTAQLKGDTTQLVLAVNGLQHETPTAPRISPDLEAGLAGLDAELLGVLAAPSKERLSRYSALARFQSQPSPTSAVFIRGGVAYSERTLEGPGPVAPARWGSPAETATDFSLAAGFVSEYKPGVTLELRGGVSGGSRSLEADEDGLTPAYLVELGLPVGETFGAPAESSRTDAVFMPVGRFDWGEGGVLKTGVLGRVSRFTMEANPWGTGDFLFSGADGLVSGRGLARGASQMTASFATRELGIFAQYDVMATDAVRLTLGARLDYESIPDAEPILDEAWLGVSGLRNDEYPSGFTQVGGVAGLTWEPAADGSTVFSVLGSLQSGDLDPEHLFEVFGSDAATTTTHMGTGLSWPGGTLPGTAPDLSTLSLLGPDTRAPRTLGGSVGLVQEIVGGVSLHLSGDFRRTDFLMRRRNLNLPVVPAALGVGSQDVYGSLTQDGALVAAVDDDARRFPEFGAVWALDPDGWSEYRGATAGLEVRTELLDVFATYTRSETKDNWIGAGDGSPDASLDPGLPNFVESWDEARSDFDRPDRLSVAAELRIPGLNGTSIGAVYRYASGAPFTPGYRRGVDANGDGAFDNDVPFVPQPEDLGPVLDEWSCLANQAGGFAVRNSCRAPGQHTLNARLAIGLGLVAGRPLRLFVEGLDLIEADHGLIDDALMLVDPAGTVTTTSGGARVTIPLQVNPGFGDNLLHTTPGRMLRIGARIGG